VKEGEHMDEKGEKAAAELYRRAQAIALMRLYRDMEGHGPESMKEFKEWASQHAPKEVKPTKADCEVVNREYPDLALLAGPSNPDLSGEN
jgi:hypothetical protein